MLVPLVTMVRERAMPQLAELPQLVTAWLQDAGGFAAVGLVIWAIAYLLRMPGARTSMAEATAYYVAGESPAPDAARHLAKAPGDWPPWLTLGEGICMACAALAYGLLGFLKIPGWLAAAPTIATFMELAFSVGLLVLAFASLRLSRTHLTPARVTSLAAALGVLAVGMFVAGLVAFIRQPVLLAFFEVTAAGLQDQCLTIGGTAAVLAAGLPFVFDLSRLRWRRIWALSTLSFKEAIRSMVLWVFSGILLVFLFADWFIEHRAEGQWRSYVQLVYGTMEMLLLFTAALLASFAIPSDVSRQTIHTVVTKPVERFEIVLGRFLGYTTLMTLVLMVMTAFSLMYVWVHGVHPDAQRESLQARVPIYGGLRLEGKSPEFQGHRIKEWDYRRWIAGGTKDVPGLDTQERAVWTFAELPTRLDERSSVPCEFSFDIFRTSKGDENKGLFCTFTFQTRNWDPARTDEYKRARERERKKPNPEPDDVVDNRLAREFGYYEFPSKEISNRPNYTNIIDVPVGLFENASTERPPAEGESRMPPVVVSVACESPDQYLGMAQHDLYLLDGKGFFWLNFFKGAAGIWFLLCLVVGLAVACSTYLSGVVSLLCTGFLFFLGLWKKDVLQQAMGRSEVGGPMESLLRLATGEKIAKPLDPSTAAMVAGYSDEAYRWFLRRFLDLLPDVQLFDLTDFVASGFDISVLKATSPTVDLLMLFVMLVGYLLPWAVLAYYLMKSREVAA